MGVLFKLLFCVFYEISVQRLAFFHENIEKGESKIEIFMDEQIPHIGKTGDLDSDILVESVQKREFL